MIDPSGSLIITIIIKTFECIYIIDPVCIAVTVCALEKIPIPVFLLLFFKLLKSYAIQSFHPGKRNSSRNNKKPQITLTFMTTMSEANF